MKTTQGWGWLAAGVLALGLNGFYQDGGSAWAHRAVDSVVARVADRAGAVIALASGRGEWFMAKANLVAARDETASCRFATMARFQTKMAHTKMTRTQSGMAHFEAMSARQEAALARMEANRPRIEAQVARLRLAPVAFHSITSPVVVCPRVLVNAPRVRVRKVPTVNIPSPVVEVDMGAGPI